MGTPVICIRNASIQNGALMVKDMWPNRSQANPVLDPAPQGPRYLRQPENVLPLVSGGVVSRAVNGLAGYFLTTIDAGAAGAQTTPAEAKDMADAVIALMRTGVALTAVNIDNELDGVVAGSGIAGTGASTATLTNIVRILGGERYSVPAGTDVNVNFLSANAQSALFDSSVYSPIVPEDSSFWISLAKGDLLGMKNANFVVVYDSADGTVL